MSATDPSPRAPQRPRRIIREMPGGRYRTPSVADIVTATAEHFGISVEALTEKYQRAERSWPRSVALTLIKEILDSPYASLKEPFGGLTGPMIHQALSRARWPSNSQRLEADSAAIRKRMYSSLRASVLKEETPP
jgi:Bacterial dnaA protein helix-turn-helix